jgi:hypothetical protein
LTGHKKKGGFKMKSKKLLIRVPELVRDYLQPYAEMFEEIVTPMAQKIPLNKIDEDLADQLEGEIDGYQNTKGQVQHFFIVYYGLMLCCMYTSQECLNIDNPNEKARRLAIINKARLLISLAYQHKAFNIIPFML